MPGHNALFAELMATDGKYPTLERGCANNAGFGACLCAAFFTQVQQKPVLRLE